MINSPRSDKWENTKNRHLKNEKKEGYSKIICKKIKYKGVYIQVTYRPNTSHVKCNKIHLHIYHNYLLL